jgi:hypothetical protein
MRFSKTVSTSSLHLSRQELFDLIKDIPNNLTETVEGFTGVTDYILPVKPSYLYSEG